MAGTETGCHARLSSSGAKGRGEDLVSSHGCCPRHRRKTSRSSECNHSARGIGAGSIALPANRRGPASPRLGHRAGARGGTKNALLAWLRCLREASDRASQPWVALETSPGNVKSLPISGFHVPVRCTRELFSIGLNPLPETSSDASSMTCWPPRHACVVTSAIAQGQISQEHCSPWTFAVAPRGAAGAGLLERFDFEYLMRACWSWPNYERTLLDQTYRGVVQYQIQYANRAACPGACRNPATIGPMCTSNYQYRHLGVAGPGLKRGLAEDLVIVLCHAIVTHWSRAESLRESAAAGRRRTSRCLRFFTRRWIIRPRGCHPGKPAQLSARSWAIIKAWAFCAGLPAAGQADAKAIPLLPRSAGMRSVAAGARATNCRQNPFGRFRVGRITKAGDRRRKRHANFHQSKFASPEVHLLSNGRYHVVVTMRAEVTAGGRTLRSAGGARMPRGIAGNFYLSSRYGNRGILVHRLPADPAHVPSGMKPSSPRAARVSPSQCRHGSPH